MMDNSLFQSILAIISIIVALVSSILGFITSRSVPQYGLECYIIFRGYKSKPKIQKKLKKYSFSHPVNGPYVVFLELRNRGATPIETKDFSDRDPINFKFEVDVFECMFEKSNPSYSQGKGPRIEKDGKAVKVFPSLLHSREGIKFLVIFSTDCGEIEPSRHPLIPKTKKTVRRHRLREALSKYLPRIQEGFEWLLAVLCIGIFAWVWLFDHNLSIYFLCIITASVVIVFVASVLRKLR